MQTAFTINKLRSCCRYQRGRNVFIAFPIRNQKEDAIVVVDTANIFSKFVPEELIIRLRFPQRTHIRLFQIHVIRSHSKI